MNEFPFVFFIAMSTNLKSCIFSQSIAIEQKTQLICGRHRPTLWFTFRLKSNMFDMQCVCIFVHRISVQFKWSLNNCQMLSFIWNSIFILYFDIYSYLIHTYFPNCVCVNCASCTKIMRCIAMLCTMHRPLTNIEICDIWIIFKRKHQIYVAGWSRAVSLFGLNERKQKQPEIYFPLYMALKCSFSAWVHGIQCNYTHRIIVLIQALIRLIFTNSDFPTAKIQMDLHMK